MRLLAIPIMLYTSNDKYGSFRPACVILWIFRADKAIIHRPTHVFLRPVARFRHCDVAWDTEVYVPILDVTVHHGGELLSTDLVMRCETPITHTLHNPCTICPNDSSAVPLIRWNIAENWLKRDIGLSRKTM